MPKFTTQELTNPDINLPNSGEYLQHLSTAVATLNVIAERNFVSDDKMEQLKKK